MTDVDRLMTALSDRYTIERELGSGGMATVYLAEDLKLHRKVALKVLRPELASALGPDRFLQEIDIAAKLNHPHILGLFDCGEAGGFLYYVMPYVEGQSLREKLAKEGELPIAEAVRILREVVDALKHAHKHGVVHRDVKPDNVMLTEDHALVTDFGVAKAVSEATGRHQLTTEGVALGTPAYMAPEQAAADPHIDQRADIYAFGVIAYELLTGRTPFVGHTQQELLAAHVTQTPEPVTRYRESVPPALAELVMKCLEKKAADRWQTAEELLPKLEALATPSGGVTPTGAEPPHTVQPRYVNWKVGLTVFVAALAVALAMWDREPPPTSTPKIAVLPPTTRGAAQDDVFADGMADAIRTRLALLSGLRVTAYYDADRYDITGKSLQQLGDELGVDHLLMISVYKDEGSEEALTVRVSAQLARASDAEIVWSEGFVDQLNAGGVFDVQRSIAEGVARGLDVTLAAREREALATQWTASLSALEYYERGSRYGRRSLTVASYRRAAEEFGKAVAEDSAFARAYATLAGSEFVLYWLTRDEEHRERGMEALSHATRLEPNMPMIHVSQGFLHYADADYTRAQEELQTALRSSPNDYLALQVLGLLQRRNGMFQEALATLTRASELDPRSVPIAANVANTYGRLRNYTEAQRYYDLIINLVPDEVLYYRSKAAVTMASGDMTEAERVLQQAADRLGVSAVMRNVYEGFYSLWFAVPDWGLSDALKQMTVTAFGADSVSFYLARAVLAQNEGDTIQARAFHDSLRLHLERRLRWIPEVSPRQHAQLGIAYAGVGRKNDAVREAMRAVELLPVSRDAFDGPTMLCYLAVTYTMVGEHQLAINQLDTLLSIPSQLSRLSIAVHPLFDPLREEPRFRRLVGDEH